MRDPLPEEKVCLDCGAHVWKNASVCPICEWVLRNVEWLRKDNMPQ